MCANYVPVTDPERMKLFFAVVRDDPVSDETWPGYAAPFVRQSREAAEGHAREGAVGLFGLVPRWSKDLAIGRAVRWRIQRRDGAPMGSSRRTGTARPRWCRA